MPYYTTNKTNIYYELHGSGPPILLIAGMSSDSKSWQFILKKLAKHYTLIIFDNRGCGRSDQKGEFSLSQLAEDAVALVEMLGYEKLHLIGHSMGGMIAQELVLAHPDRIDKLVLASTSPKLSTKAKGILDDLHNKWLEGYDLSEWFRLMFKWLFTADAIANKKFMDAAIIFALSYPYPQSMGGFTAQLGAIISFDAVDRISNIKNKTLILSGREDILIPFDESQQLRTIEGDTTFKIIENAAHSIHAEQPDRFVEVVREFLSE